MGTKTGPSFHFGKVIEFNTVVEKFGELLEHHVVLDMCAVLLLDNVDCMDYIQKEII